MYLYSTSAKLKSDLIDMPDTSLAPVVILSFGGNVRVELNLCQVAIWHDTY